MEWVPQEPLTTMTALFSAMIFLVWILPGIVNRSGKFPEDRSASR